MYAMQQGLVAMYVADARFTAIYEAQAPGMAQDVHGALRPAGGHLALPPAIRARMDPPPMERGSRIQPRPGCLTLARPVRN
jgi:hypothetical protein